MLEPIIKAEYLESFLKNKFEKQVAVLEQSEFESFGFDLRSFFDILLNHRWAPEKLRFTSRDDPRDSSELYQSLIAPSGRFTLDRIKGSKSAKITTVVNGIGFLHQGLRRMLAAMGCNGYYHIGANAYFTPAQSRGFAPHWDTHDVFLLQVHGSKKWSISHSPVCELPIPRPEFEPALGVGFPTEPETVTLCHGNVLYIPRGFLHSGESLDSDSLHITVRLTPLTPADILRGVAKQLPKDAESLRVSLRSLGEDESSQAEEMKELFLKYLAEADIKKLLAGERASITALERENSGETFGSDVKQLLINTD